MTDRLRIALAQLNPKVGDLSGNLDLGRAALADALAANADILMLPELFLTGYIPEDLLFKPQFVADAMKAAHALVAATAGTDITLILPTIWRDSAGLRNAVLVAEGGEILATRFKRQLPNADVFYEQRYFHPGAMPDPVTVKGVPVGIPICEDIWHTSVCEHLAMRGAEIMLCPNGSPYWRGKLEQRQRLVQSRVAESDVPMLYLNQVGGQDELVFDGASFAIEPDGGVVVQGRAFASDFILSDWVRGEKGWTCEKGDTVPQPDENAAPWQACVLGLRDYMAKNGFSSAVLGLSGGIDSAVVAAMAVDALGADKVHCVMLPYRYTTPASLKDARDCAEALGVRYDIVSIGNPVDAALAELAPLFEGRSLDLTEENIQSRMRGLVLMAISNKLGSMLLSTGNKSEMGVGYATIYGDMNGGYNPLKDMYKMEVYRLAKWRNALVPDGGLGPSGAVIPMNIIAKAPSAELRPDQTDQDSLPPYPVLDAILADLVEEDLSLAQIVAKGHDAALVARIERLVNIAEYKRHQSAPGPKISPRAFGFGRRYPITNGYKDRSIG